MSVTKLRKKWLSLLLVTVMMTSSVPLYGQELTGIDSQQVAATELVDDDSNTLDEQNESVTETVDEDLDPQASSTGTYSALEFEAVSDLEESGTIKPLEITFGANDNFQEITVPTDTVWNLKFDQDADVGTLTEDYIYVLDQEGNQVEISVVRKDYQTIYIAPEQGAYLPGQSYVLVLTKDIKNQKGESLGQTINIPFTSEYGRWEAGDAAFLMGELVNEEQKMYAGEASGLFFYSVLRDLALEQEETYEISIRADIEKDSTIGLDREVDSNPVIMTLTLYEDRNHPICQDLEVRASDFGNGFTDLKYLFTLPEDDAGNTLILQLKYWNLEDKNNICNLSVDNVHVEKVPLYQLDANYLQGSHTINSVIMSEDNGYSPQVQSNPSLSLEQLASGNFRVSYISQDLAETDTDGDGLYDELERNGFVYSTVKGFELWNGKEGDKYYKTDPTQWSTDGDPYGDQDEVTGLHIDSSIKEPGNDPLVASFPIMSIDVSGYTIVPQGEISLSNSRSVSSEFSESSSTTDTVSDSSTKGGEVSVSHEFGLLEGGTSVSASAHYEKTHTTEHSVTKETGSTNGSAQEWAQATTSNPGEAAHLKLNVKLKNSGTATARDIVPTFNISIGDRLLTTVTPSSVNVLRPDMETEEFIIDSDSDGDPIVLTLSELKSLQLGAPLKIKLLDEQTDAKVSRWDEETNNWDTVASWIDSKTQIESRTATLRLGQDKEVQEYKVFAGSDYYSPQITLGQALLHVSNYQKREDGIYINGQKLTSRWIAGIANMPEDYLEKNPPKNNELMNLVLTPGMQISLDSRNFEPRIIWAKNYHSLQDYQQKMEAWIVPGMHPIERVYVKGIQNGQSATILMSKSADSLYYEADLPDDFVALEVGATDRNEETIVFKLDGSEGQQLNDGAECFFQGAGYEQGGYYAKGQPTTFNWTRQSQFIGPEEKPNLRWQKQCQYTIKSTPVVVGDDEVFVMSDNYQQGQNESYFLKTSDNGVEVVRQWNSPYNITKGQPVVDALGRLYVEHNWGGPEIFDSESGEYLGKGDPSVYGQSGYVSEWGAGYAIGSDMTLYGIYGKKLIAFDRTTDDEGKIKLVSRWEYALDAADDFTNANPAIGKDGTIFLAGGEHIYAITSSGQLKWKTLINFLSTYGSFAYTVPVIGDDGTVYVLDTDGYLRAVNPDDGSIIWKTNTPSNGWNDVDKQWTVRAPAIGADGNIYYANVSSTWSYMVSINPRDGSTNWTHNFYGTNAYILSAPLIGADGTIYIGAYNGVLYAVDSATGDEKWQVDTGGGEITTSPAMDQYGNIYVAAGDTVYAYGQKKAGEFQFANPYHTIEEQDGTVTLEIARTGGLEGDVTLHPYIYGISADSGTDYVELSEQSITFQDGELFKKIEINLKDDNVYEGTECLNVILQLDPEIPAEEASIGSYGKAIITIMDNDESPSDIETFKQGEGYLPGAYDLEAQQPTSVNYNGWSRFAGPDQKPEKNWDFTAGEMLLGSAAVGSDMTTYMASASMDDSDGKVPYGKIYAVNSDGTEKWSFPNDPDIAVAPFMAAPVIGADGTIYAFCMDGKLYALDEQGNKKWDQQLQPGGELQFSPAIASDGTLYVGGDKLYAINPEAGPDYRVKWDFVTEDGIQSAPAIARDGTIYIGDRDGILYAVEPNGTEKWRIKIDEWNRIVGQIAIGSDHTIYFGSSDGKVYAINPDGSQKWVYDTGADQAISPIVGRDGTIYIGTQSSGKLIAIDASGSQKWETAVEGAFMSAPIIDPMGTIYIGSAEGTQPPGTGTLYAFDSNGQEKWAYEIGGGIYFSSPAIAKDGTLFVTACDNKLYSLGGQGQVMFDVTESVVDEGAGTVNLTVKRIGPAQGEVRVDYTLENGSATYGEDFLGSADTIVFGDGEISKDIAIEIIDDRTYEIDDQTCEQTENFSVWLSNPEGGVVLGNNNRITVIIKDNDPIPAENLQFLQGQGYAWGFYDYEAAQPTVFNWTRQSQFMGGYTNDEKWDIDLGKAITTSPVIGFDGSVYISADNQLFKVRSDGNTVWTQAFEQKITSPIIGPDEILYVGCQNGILYGINGNTGDIYNSCEMINNEPISDPPVLGEYPRIYVRTELGNLYVVVAPHGDEWYIGENKGNYENNAFMTGVSSGLAIGSQQCVIAGQDFTLGCVGQYGDDYTELGQVNGTIMETPVIGADGTVYVVGNTDEKGGALGAFTSAGVEKWSRYLNGEVIIHITSSPAIAKDGTIYFGADDGNLYAIDPSDGSEIWTYDTGGVVESTPLIGNDGTVFVGSSSNKFYAIHADGILKWEYNAGSAILSSPAMGRDGTLYFGTEDGRLLAVGGKLGEVSFEYDSYEVNENEGSIDITLIQEGSTQMPLTLVCSTDDGTAIAGEDYVAINENIVFAPGETEKKVTLTCINDDVFEGRKNLHLVLSNPKFEGLGLGDSIEAMVYIMDDDEILFEQGQGYEQGDYDVTAPQAAAFNWNRRTPVAAMAQQDAKWAFATGDAIQSSAAVGADGTLYFGSMNHKVYAVNPDGSQKWAYLTQGSVMSSPTMGADGTIYVGSNDHYLYALNPDGSLQWKYEAGGALQSSPAIDFDGNIIIGSMDQYLYSIDKNGTPNWKMSTEGEILSSPSVGNDGRIYVGSRDQKLYAFDPNGVLLWTVETKGDIESSPVIGDDGTIYIGSFDDTLYAIDPNGSIKWTFAADDWFKSTPAIGADGTIYVGSFDHYLYAIDSEGHEKWRFDAQGRIQSSALVDGQGTIYIGTHDGMLYGINPDGTLATQIELNEEIQSSPAMSSNGTLYVGTSEGNFYAIGEISAEERPIWPQGPSVTTEELQSTQVTLSWTAASEQDVAEYGIYQDGSLMATVSGEVQTWMVTDLVPETEYTFQIQYHNAVGIWSTDGPSVTCTTLQQVPDVTSPIWSSDKSLSVIHAGEDTLTLQWTSATDDIGVTQYQIYQDDQLIDAVEGAIHEYVVDSLRPGTAYEYRVEAGDAVGNWSSDGPIVTGETLVSDKVQLTIEKVLVGPGQEVILPITLKNGSGISGFQFAIGYDPNQITSITPEKGTLISDDSSWMITDNPKEGKLMILGYNGLSEGLSAGDGELINLRITVNSTMGEATCIPIVFDDTYDLLAIGPDEQGVSVLAIDGEIKVFAYPKGDANNDNVVNVLDVGYAVNMALEKIEPTESEKCAADVNQDGQVNVLDVTKIADIALRWTE